MADYNRGGAGGGRSFGGGGRSFGGKPSFGGQGGRGNSRPQMHRATCDECGNQCEVPFRPSGEKPVFCNDCFAYSRDSQGPTRRNDSPRPERREFVKESPRGMSEDQFKTLNSKLDEILRILGSQE